MVNGEILRFTRQAVPVPFRLLADSANTLLLVQHVLITLRVDASGRPLALFDVMRVAQPLGVKVAVAGFDHARLSRPLPVRIPSVPVSEEALVVHLAQVLGLDRLAAALFAALRQFDAHSALDRPDRGDPAFKLHVVRKAEATSVVFASTGLKGAGVGLLAHKKTPFRYFGV
jgi:hypothetical protein